MEFWEEVRIQIMDIPTMVGLAAKATHMYNEVNWVSRNALLKLISRVWAIIDIMKLMQRDRNSRLRSKVKRNSAIWRKA